MRIALPASLRVLVVALALAVAGVLAPATADAHAYLVATTPADGTAVDSLTELRFEFTQPVVAHLTKVKVIGESGQVVASAGGGGGAPLTPQTSGRFLVVPLPRLPDGQYEVLWSTASQDDLHAVPGDFIFAVGKDAKAPAAVHTIVSQPEPAPGVGEVLSRWALFAALAALTGLLALAAVAPAVAERLRRHSFVAAAASIVLALVLLVVQVDAVGGFGQLRDVLLDTGFGQGLLVRIALVLVAADLALGRRYRAAAASAALAAAAGALGSHAATLGLGAEIVMAFHLAAAAVWAGIVPAAAYALGPALARGGQDRTDAVAALRRLGFVAGPAAGVLVVTGTYSLGRHVATVDALITTVYGAGVLVKIGLLVVALLLAAVTNRAVRSSTPSAVRRSLPIEAIVLVAILLPAAVLAAGSPANGPRYTVGPPAKGSLLVTQTNGDLIVSLSLVPNRPGKNAVHVNAVQTTRPVRGEIDRVVVAAAGSGLTGGEVSTAKQTDTLWVSPSILVKAAGAIRLTTRVSRAGLDDVVVSTPWVVGAGSALQPAPLTVSRKRLEPITTTLAVLLTVALVVFAGVAWRRRTP